MTIRVSMQATVGAIRGYAGDLRMSGMDGDPVRRDIFARQLNATAATTRWLFPLGGFFTCFTVLLFWSVANQPLMLVGTSLTCGVYAWLWTSMPRVVSPQDMRGTTTRHMIGAAGLGIGLP